MHELYIRYLFIIHKQHANFTQIHTEIVVEVKEHVFDECEHSIILDVSRLAERHL